MSTYERPSQRATTTAPVCAQHPAISLHPFRGTCTVCLAMSEKALTFGKGEDQ